MSVARMTAREIADDIAARIPAEYPPGSRLEFKTLRTLYGDVSRATMQRTMALLQDRKLAVYVIGIGWFVDDPADNP